MKVKIICSFYKIEFFCFALLCFVFFALNVPLLAACHVVCHLCFGGLCFAGHMDAVGGYCPLVGHRGFNR